MPIDPDVLVYRLRRRSILRRRFLLLALLVGSIPFAEHAAADGTQTGVVAGTVTDADGRSLPGARVVLDGPDGRREVVTDDGGRFRVPALRPGSYDARASLLSLEDRRSDLAVYIGRTTQVTLRLHEPESVETESDPVLPGPSESVQVVALAPLVDPLDARVRSVVRREFLDVLPVQRFYQSVALLLPGVAGGEDGNPNVGGALRGNNLFLVDGVDTTDPVTGLFGLNLAYDAVESVEVLTAGLPAEHGRASGAVINVVTRTPDGRHRGSARAQVEPRSARSDYRPRSDTPYLEAEIAAANTDSDDARSVAVTLGGPLLRSDRAWYFAAVQDGESKDPRPTLEGDPWDAGVALDAELLRVGARLGDHHSLDAQYTSDAADAQTFAPLQTVAENTTDRPPTFGFDALILPLPGDLAAVTRQRQSGSFGKLEWNAVLGPSWTLGASISAQERALDREPARLGDLGAGLHADVTSLAPNAADSDLDDVFDELALYNGITDVGREERPRRQGSLSLGWFRAGERIDHDLRFGLDVQITESRSDLRPSGTAGVDPRTGAPVVSQIFFDLLPTEECLSGGPCGSFDPVNDTFSPFLLIQRPPSDPARTRAESVGLYVGDALVFGRWLIDVGLRFESQEATDDLGERLVRHRSVAPRLAVKYDARGDGSTLYSLHYGRYYEPFPQGFLDSFVRPDFFSGGSLYAWDPDVGACGDPADPASPCWVFADAFDAEPLQEVRLDPGIRRTRMDEWVIGFERRLSPTLGLHLHGIDRRWHDLWDDALFVAPDFSLDLDRSSVRNIEEAERRHQSVRLLLQKRFSNRWQMLASLTRGRTEGNLFSRRGDSTFFDFTDFSDGNLVNRYGPAPYDRTDQLRLFGLYELPLPRVTVTFGTAFSYESGVPWQPFRQNPDLGAVVFLEPRGNRRLDDVMQWDLSLNADIDTGTDLDLVAKLELFNVFNDQTQIGVEPNIEQPGFGGARGLVDLQAPRRVRLSLELRF